MEIQVSNLRYNKQNLYSLTALMRFGKSTTYIAGNSHIYLTNASIISTCTIIENPLLRTLNNFDLICQTEDKCENFTYADDLKELIHRTKTLHIEWKPFLKETVLNHLATHPNFTSIQFDRMFRISEALAKLHESTVSQTHVIEAFIFVRQNLDFINSFSQPNKEELI